MLQIINLNALTNIYPISLKDILTFCGYEEIILSNEKKLYFFMQKKNEKKKNNRENNIKLKKKKNEKIQKKLDPNSPFAVLEKLL